jgi:hypothetical protein
MLKLEPEKDVDDYNYVYICSYNVCNDGKFPFMKFLLTNSNFDDLLSFPEVPIFKKLTCEELIPYTKVCLFATLMLNDYDKFSENTDFKGCFDFNNNLYLFFDITRCDIQIDDIFKINRTWFTLLDEILNHKHLCNMPIDKNVTNFFVFNDEFCFLLDENGDSYEIPMTSFVAKNEKLLNFTYVFGETKSDKNSILGPFYYFSDFYTSFKESCDYKLAIKNGKTTQSGLIRFALFVGRTKYFENNLSDKIDESEIKKQRLNDENMDKNKECLTNRISDHDGLWSKEYDSAYLGTVELDNGNLLNNHLIAIKEYNQQIPLSYHYVNKKEFENNNQYLIC